MAVQKEIFPSRAIRSTNKEEANFLVGRQDSIIQGLLQVQKADSIVAVMGERGVGKTSVASQILNSLSARNDHYLEDVLDLDMQDYPVNKYDCIYVRVFE